VKVRFVDAAEAELDTAFQHYESEVSGLGADFLTEVTLVVSRILELPNAWQELESGVRCCRLKRFPYGVIYSLRHDHIVVLGVTHLHRKPMNWRRRLKKD
jgi:toxin ParE2